MNKVVLLMVLLLDIYTIGLDAQVRKPASVKKVATSVSPQANITKYRQLGEDGYVWYKVKKGNLFGAQSVDGKDIVPAIFDDVVYECRNYKDNFSDWNIEMSTKWFRVKSGDNIGLYSIDGNCLVSPERYHSNYSVGIPTIDTHYMGKMFLYISKDKKVGVLDVQGREVIPPIYDQIHNDGFRYMSGRVKNEGNRYGAFMIVDKSYPRWGYTDLNGKIILYPSENKLGAVLGIHDNGILYISKCIEEGSPGKWADTNYDYDENIRFDYSNSAPIFGKYFTKLYDSSISTSDGRTLYVKNDNGFRSIMDAERNIIIPSSRGYTQVNMYGTGNDNWGFYIQKAGKWGIADKEGREIMSPQYDAISGAGMNRVKFKMSGAWGIMDYTGNVIVPVSQGYSSIVKLDNAKLYKVGKSGRYGIVNYEGKEIVPTELETLESAGNGYLRYKLNGFWGLMNYTGKIIIDTDRGYTSIGDYKSFNKRFAYTMTGYKGECDATGRQISKIKVDAPQQNTSVASSSGTSSSSSSGSGSNSGNNTTTIHVEHHHDPVPVQQWQACIGCGGMGTMGCDFCGGSGTRYVGDRLHRCSRCNGKGIIPCNVCYGNKGQYITVYK